MKLLEGDRAAAIEFSSPRGLEKVDASWQHCLSEHRLDPSQQSTLPCISGQKLKEMQDQLDRLISEASPIIDELRRLARDAGRVVLLSNAEGIVLRNYSDSAAALEMLPDDLAPGTVLQEKPVCTNGIGTRFALRIPTAIAAAAHVKEELKVSCCSAAPIFGPDGNVIAELNISIRSGANEAENYFANHCIQRAAHEISHVVFRRIHRNDCILSLSAKSDHSPISNRALLAMDAEGRLLGATQEGFAFLGVGNLNSLVERRINHLFDVKLADLEPVTGHSVRLRTPTSAATFATTFTKRGAPKSLAAMAAKFHKRPDQEPPNKPLDQLILGDSSMEQIIELCRKIMDRGISLLLLGETGVGKDTLARAIHAESERAKKPYIAISCAAIPATLLASELFGYAPGTFTDGAKSGKSGKILSCDGGTLFLDEIGDMPLDLQAHLLRVLEDRRVTPLGSSHSLPVDISVICATHRNLRELIAAGQFRKDLYYRIRGAEVAIPALRERTDLEHLAHLLINEEATDANGNHIGIAADVMTLFRRYRWPGNIRELRSVIRFALALCGKGSVISLAHLPDELLTFVVSADTIAIAEDIRSKVRSSAKLRHLTANNERRKIVEILRSHSWNVANAAPKLGISRATLYRKIQKYSIEEP